MDQAHPLFGIRRARAALLAAAVASAAALGCARPEPEVPASAPDGLVRIPTQHGGTLYVRPNRGIDGYDDTYVSEIGIAYAEGQSPLSGSGENRIYQRLLTSRTAELEARGGQVAKGPGPCTLAQSLYLTELELFETRVTGAQTNVVSSFGAVTVVTEFRDSLTNEVLVRYGARQGLGGGVTEGRVRPELDRLDQALQAVLAVMGETLRAELPQSPLDARAAQGCSGRIGQHRREAPKR
jgi:hypothetical protein